MRSRIDSGPYSGIYTTFDRKRFVETLSRDLATQSPSTCSILFYDKFPAGYLLSSSRPKTNAVFQLIVQNSSLVKYRTGLLGYYATRGGPPDVIVRMISVPGVALTRPITQVDPLDQLAVRSGAYARVQKRAEYEIYARRTARCLAT